MNYTEWKQEYLELLIKLIKQHEYSRDYTQVYMTELANELLERGAFFEDFNWWKEVSPKKASKESFKLWLADYFEEQTMDIQKVLEQHKIWVDSNGKEGERADLSDATLINLDLSGVDLRGAQLRDINLSGADLRNTNLSDADLTDANLRGADLREANFNQTILPKSTFIILGEYYFVSICGDCVRAGCQVYSASEWRQFSMHDISRMHGLRAIRFYPRLLDIIDFYCGKGERPEWLKERNNG